MKKLYSLLFFTFFLFVSEQSYSQDATLSENAEVSILTIGPGSYLYDKFGHSALRVKDPVSQWDIIYNFGVYDFKTPNFYTKFAQGKLLYKLDTSRFGPFYDGYARQNRYINEQVLDLSHLEKQQMFDFLQNNAQPENRDYLYDFFFDNCATRIRDVFTVVLGDQLQFNHDHLPESETFRDLIQNNLKSNTWGSLGIDVALGAIIDRKATPAEYQYLPEYVFQAAQNASLQKKGVTTPLVKKTTSLFKNKGVKTKHNFFLSPLFIFGLLSLIIIYITYRDFKKEKRTKWLDITIFIITGLIGVFILLLWFATDHTATANNYNLLWAFPFNLILLLGLNKQVPKKWTHRFVLFLVLMLLLLCMHWISGVQVFAIGLIPLLIALGIRYLFLLKYLKKQGL